MRVVGDKSSLPKALKNVFFSESLVEGSSEREEEFRLADMRDLGLDKVLDFSAVHLLQDIVTTDVERLYKMRGIGR